MKMGRLKVFPNFYSRGVKVMDKNTLDAVQDEQHGERNIVLQIQTPRGLWNMELPPDAKKRPSYPPSTKVSQVIADAREVFKFTENDNKYTLLREAEKLAPERTLASYRLRNGELLVLSVQGGNAFDAIEGAVSLDAIQRELSEAAPFAASAQLIIDSTDLTEKDLRFFVNFYNRNGDAFYAEFDCRDYPLYPPMIEFTDHSRTIRGQKELYPNVFHANPCICMRYSRKAYQEHGGPHGEWRMLDWHLATPGGGVIDTLAMIISDLHSKILDATGRMSN